MSMDAQSAPWEIGGATPDAMVHPAAWSSYGIGDLDKSRRSLRRTRSRIDCVFGVGSDA